jgi:hypothetical protein
MNNVIPNLRIEKKLVSRGTKTSVKVFSGDTLIGSRTSARNYRFALVVKFGQPCALAYAKSQLAHDIKMEAQYRGVALDLPGARDAWKKSNIRFHAREWDTKCYEKFLAEGNFLEWANDAAKRVINLRLRVAALEAGPLPEFDRIFILSWHGARKNVPTPRECYDVVTVLEIPE